MPRYADEQWQTMLTRLAERDAPVELSRRSAEDDAPAIAYRTRLFDVTENGGIIVERPAQAVRDRSFGVGDDIELLLMHNNDRLVATCTIQQVFIHEINEHLRPSCYLLSPGRRPQRDQRRSFFRVNIAAQHLEPAVLRHTPADDQTPVSFNAHMVNLSAGGLGVTLRLSHELLQEIKRTRRFHCQADFGEGEVFDLPVRVAHVAAVGEDGLYLGMRFELEDAEEKQAVEDRLNQVCVRFQREALKRQRA